MAFQNYKPWLGITGSEWVGLDNFRFLFQREDSLQVVWNTLIITVLKMFFNLLVPFVFAILLNEVRKVALQRSIQTLVYLAALSVVGNLGRNSGGPVGYRWFYEPDSWEFWNPAHLFFGRQ